MENGENVEGSVVPRDIIINILKQLPAKALLRFRCVSKLWCSIIDDPLFIQLHNKHSHTRPGGVTILVRHIDSNGSEFYSLDPEGGPHNVPLLRVPSLSTHKNFEIVDTLQSVNGLVCILNCIWNPTTRQRIDIPTRKTRIIDVGLDLPFNNLKFYSTYSLGFDPSSHQYKILHKFLFIWDRGISREQRVEYKILTIGTNSWRDINSIPRHLYPFISDEMPSSCIVETSCCIGGVLYSFATISNKDIILAFEVRQEKFRIIPLPPGDDFVDSFYYYNLIQVRERLAIIDDDVSTIWILEDYENILWNRQSFIFPDHYEGKPLAGKDGGEEIYFIPIGGIHTGEILLKSGCRNLGRLNWAYDPESLAPKLFYYNLESKRLRMVDELSNLPGIVLRDGYFTKHVESLFRLKRV